MRIRISAVLAGVLLLGVASVGRADQKSTALFARAKSVAAKTRSLRADLSMTAGTAGMNQKMTGSVKVLKPAKFDLRVSMANGKQSERMVSDGKTLFNVMEEQKQYMKMDSRPEMVAAMGVPAAAMLIGPSQMPGSKGARYIGKIRGDGREYDVVKLGPQQGMPKEMSVKYFFGPSGLPEGQEMTMRVGRESMTQKTWLRKLQLNAELPESDFAYAPPADFKVFEPGNYDASLLAVDKEAPDFLLPQPGGGTQLSLSDARKDKKLVLVNFWFYG